MGTGNSDVKFYAVKVGRQPGIYCSWPECQAQVIGFSGAVFRSFLNLEAAEEFLSAGRDPDPINESLPSAYIDGSFSPKRKIYSYGGFIQNGTCHVVQGNGSRPEYLPERNIAGELLGTLHIVYKCIELGIPEINLFFDYIGIERYVTGEWKSKTPLAKHYTDKMNLFSNEVKVHFQYVPGHTGIEGNELADILAKRAAGVKIRKKDIVAINQLMERAKAS